MVLTRGVRQNSFFFPPENPRPLPSEKPVVMSPLPGDIFGVVGTIPSTNLADTETGGNSHAEKASVDRLNTYTKTTRILAYCMLSLSTAALMALLAIETRSLMTKFLAGSLSLTAVVSLVAITLVDMRSPPLSNIIRSMDCLLRGLVLIFLLTLFAALLS